MSGMRFALKRLSASDLTLFADHFNNSAGTRQKAINLDKAAMRQLYPDIVTDVERGLSIPIELAIYGPDGKVSLSANENIKVEEKNIRLGQALIHAHPTDELRFTGLAPNDFALLAFVGSDRPVSLQICLVSAASLKDVALHQELVKLCGPQFSSRTGLIVVDAILLNEAAKRANVLSDHPFFSVVNGDALEDLSRGGESGVAKLTGARVPALSKEALLLAKASADEIGRRGEQLLNYYLEQERVAGRLSDFEWTADKVPLSPYDFALKDAHGNIVRKLDAKSTKGPFDNMVHISMAELRHMASSTVPYDIYRLYAVMDKTAMLRVTKDIRHFAVVLINALHALPNGVVVDGFSLDPSVFDFADEIEIDISELEVDDFSS